jgi:hypothetical protein
MLNYLVLFVALALSAVAAYYSIAGLVVLFAAAAIPVMVMASTLEFAKVVATSWVYRNWDTAPRFIKYYLTLAIAVLMLVTSMGIFGFLSKAHVDQGVPASQVQDQLALFDEKIKTEKDNIDAYRKAIKQMDDAVDQTLLRTEDEKGANKAAYLRRSQQKERTQMATEIAKSQANITALQEQRAPIAAEVRKVVAEVGPIKYIAELFYENADSTILDKAVRWVIILLVVVFDPLAIILLVAANHSLRGGTVQPTLTKTKSVKQKMPEWLLRETRVKRMKKLHEKKRRQRKSNNKIEIDKDSLITF